MVRERRLVFGEIADLYDRHRPAYPEPLIADLTALAGLDGSRAVLEVGAGTGKATAMFAARGIPVVAVEPSGEMAELARRNCSGYPDVEIEQSDFEHWDDRGRRFPLLFSAQAWHWVQPAAGYARARHALTPGGVLAVFRNDVAWEHCDFREALLATYQRLAPEHAKDDPMHPASVCPAGNGDWKAHITTAEGFGSPEARYYDWRQDYSPGDYVGLLATTSEIRMMDEQRRTALLDSVAAAIDRHGGLLTLSMRTQLCVARRT
jgi:SAM-dependent methyltransferase